MIQHYQPSESDDATPDEIVAEISASRQRIDSQLHRLAESVTPQALVNNAAERLTDHSLDEAIDGISHYYAKARAYIRKRPLATALLALGVAALILESSNHERKRKPRPRRSEPNPRRNYDI